MKNPDVVKALIKIAADWSDGDVQIEAIKYLATFGRQAEEALPVLRQVKQDASRPLTHDDFQEQERLLGYLTAGILARIENKEPISQDRIDAASHSIEAIEKSIKTH